MIKWPFIGSSLVSAGAVALALMSHFDAKDSRQNAEAVRQQETKLPRNSFLLSWPHSKENLELHAQRFDGVGNAEVDSYSSFDTNSTGRIVREVELRERLMIKPGEASLQTAIPLKAKPSVRFIDLYRLQSHAASLESHAERSVHEGWVSFAFAAIFGVFSAVLYFGKEGPHFLGIKIDLKNLKN